MSIAVDLTMLLQGSTPDDQVGYHSAFSRSRDGGRLAGYEVFPYRAASDTTEWRVLWDAVIRHMSESSSNVLYLQYFHGRDIPDPLPFIDRVRSLPQCPLVITSCGDAFGARLNAPPASLMRAASRSDLFLSTSMGRLARLAKSAGSARVTLMPNSACDVRFAPTPPPPANREYDVVFIGNKPDGRNPLRAFYWAGRHRKEYVDRLTRRYGSRFALFGHGWRGNSSWHGPAEFGQQPLVSQIGRVVFGGYPGSVERFYTSNRPFIQALSAVPIIDFHVPGVERLLRDGIDWLLFHDMNEAIRLIDRVLNGTVDGVAMGARAAEAVRSRHLNSHRVDLILTMLEELLDARRHGRSAVCPPLDFLSAPDDPANIGACIGW